MCIGGSAILGHVLALPHHVDDWSTYNGQVIKVIAAMDGESINIAASQNHPAVTVHLLGLAKMNDRWDSKSRDLLNSMLRGKRITLHLEPTQTRDSAGRLLAFAFDPDAKPVSAEVVRQGLALADRRMAYAFHASVDQAETEARKKHRGLWAIARSSDMPAWRQQWTARPLADTFSR